MQANPMCRVIVGYEGNLDLALDRVTVYHGMQRDDKMELVGYCLQQAGFTDIAFHDRSPLGAEPMWIRTAREPWSMNHR